MRTQRFVHRLVYAVIVAGLLLGPPAPLAHAQGGPRFLPLIQHPSASITPQQPDTPGLFRTLVQVQTAVQWRDLERMQPVFLDRGDDWAWLLVDDAQLAELARLRYNPDQTNSLGTLLAAQDVAVRNAFDPLWTQAQALAAQVAARPDGEDAARAELRAAMHALAAEPRTLLATAAAVDGDGDGATDDQETWWCTDPTKPDTDFDGASDGAELAALKEWAGNSTRDRLRAGPPVTGQPFIGWPPDNPGCLDNDHDSIPNLAELYFLGFNMAAESTDRDQFDDGQELFGTTNCPDSGTSCGYGSLPPASNDPGVVLFPKMPGWVRAPGNHPLVAGLPVVEIDIVPSSLNVKTVTTITTDRTISQGTEKSYSTAKTEGTSTSVANTESWNSWQEVAESYQEKAGVAAARSTGVLQPSSIESFNPGKFAGGALQVVGGAATGAFVCGGGASGTLMTAGLAGGVGAIACAGGLAAAAHLVGAGIADLDDTFSPDLIQNNVQMNRYQSVDVRLQNEVENKVDVVLNQSFDTSNRVAALEGNRLAYLQAGQVMNQRLYEIGQILAAPTRMTSQAKGQSWGGSQTTTTEAYEELTVTDGEAFSTVEAWSTATAVDSAHAADLRFSYTLTNRGDDFARKICDIAFNVYIGDGDSPAATYDLGPDLGGDGCLHNFQPGGAPIQRTITPLPLSLDQLRALDTGAPLRVVLSRYVLSTEDDYAADAAARGLAVALEDGTADGDELIDSYLLPTWKSGETVLQVLGRYFPHETGANGTLTAIWTPEYRSDTPSWCVEPKRPIDQPAKAVWCKHALSVADWWNVYTDGLGDGSQGFQDTPAVPGAVALFRFNQDTDHDGFSDRSEARLGTDPKDASSFPQPEVLAGVHSVRSGNQVQATLSLLNTGVYDAYGVEAVMVAPDDSVSITNNTVGGSGRVAAQQQVIVGSRLLLPTPLPAPWSQDGHAVPAVGGYYTGSSDRTYAFTVANCPSGGCQVGSGSWTLNWSDGAGGSGSLAFGDGYKSPTFVPVSNGLTLALYSGSVQNGERFTVSAQTPRDTFQYTINREPYIAPLVIVSYNNPQGNHRLVVPAQAMALTSPTDNLQVYAGQMLHDVGVEVVSRAPFAPGSNTLDLLVNNPSDTALAGARLFLEVVNVEGTVVNETSTQVDVPPGPKSVAMSFSTGSFNPAYVPEEDYILLAFLTDSQGNILDTAGRPLSSLQADPRPNVESANLSWDFGFVPQGSLLRHPLALANTGSGPLYLYLPPTPGLSLVRPSDTVGAADLSDYKLLLRTRDLPAGLVDQVVTLRTSDPDRPTLQVSVQGIIDAPNGGIPSGALMRPLDVPVTVQGPKSQGEWVTFSHTLGPDPQSLHPVKVYSADYTSFKGAGKYATAFSQEPASYGGNLDANNGVGVGSVATNPPASTQELTRYIAEQVEASPHTRGRLNLPESVTTSATYQVQYGRKLDFAAAGEQATTLRLPAGMLAAASLDLLVSGVGSGDLTLKLDIGADGSWEADQTQAVNDAGTFPISNLAAAFNRYWQAQGAPVSGSLDLPVKVSLSKPGQALLTNLQLNTAGSTRSYLRTPIRRYTQFNLALQVDGSGSSPLAIAVDVGNNGTLDWSGTRAASLPLRLLTGDLSAAVNAYLDPFRDDLSIGDELDVPIRIHVAPDRPVSLLDYTGTDLPAVDLAAQPPQVNGPTLAAVADTAAGPSYSEGATLQVQTTVQNAGSRPSGPFTVAFFAGVPGWGDWYIGSAFVPNLFPGRSVQVGTSWNTLGFGGTTPVKATVNPYGRTGETSLTNNSGSVMVNIVPQPQPPTAAFSATPLSGRVSLTVQFTDASTSPLPMTSWLWDFGDGTTSTQQHPTHIYNRAGVYTVKLTVANRSGSDDEAKSGYITVTAAPAGVVADFSATPTRGIAPLNVAFQDLSSGPLTGWQWDFGDNGTASERNPEHTYTTPGVYTVKLTVSSASGSNNKTRTGFITVDPKQAQTITFDPLPNRTLGDPPFALSATASSGLPVRFGSDTPAICAVAGATATLLAVGQCSITATQAGNADYLPAEAVTATFRILPAAGELRYRIYLPEVVQ